MLEKAQNCLLKFDLIPVNPDTMAVKHESYTSFYKLMPPYYRPMGKVVPGKGITNEYLHPSVIKRFRKDPTFRPKNLVDYFKRHPI